MSVRLTSSTPADFLAAGDIAGLIEYRRSLHGDLRMEADEETGGEGEGDPKPDEEPGTGTGEDEDLDDEALAALLEQADAKGDLGYPKDTRVVDMTPEQQAAYWRDIAKRQQKRADAALKGKPKPAPAAKPEQPRGKPADQPGGPNVLDVLQRKERANALSAAIKAAVKPELVEVALDALRAQSSKIEIDEETLEAKPETAKKLVEDYLKNRPGLKATGAPRLPGTTNGGQGDPSRTTGRRSLADAIGARMRGEQ